MSLTGHFLVPQVGNDSGDDCVNFAYGILKSSPNTNIGCPGTLLPQTDLVFLGPQKRKGKSMPKLFQNFIQNFVYKIRRIKLSKKTHTQENVSNIFATWGG